MRDDVKHDKYIFCIKLCVGNAFLVMTIVFYRGSVCAIVWNSHHSIKWSLILKFYFLRSVDCWSRILEKCMLKEILYDCSITNLIKFFFVIYISYYVQKHRQLISSRWETEYIFVVFLIYGISLCILFR